jgi:hypothetical protein
MSRDEGGAVATTVSILAVLGVMVLFCAFFTVFLILPLFIFLAGVVALVVTERKAKSH